MKRRDLLATTGTVVAGTLAGCAKTSATVKPPEPSKKQLSNGGWKELRSDTQKLFEKDYGVTKVTATASTRVWEDAALRQSLKEKTMGKADTQVSVFFATRVAISPTLTSIPDAVKDPLTNEVQSRASKMFKEQLKGTVKNIKTEDVSKELAIETGEKASLTKYTAEVELPKLDYSLSKEKSLSIKGGTLKIDGFLATWIHNGAIYVAGGIYPGENYTRSIKKDLTSAIHAEVNVDLGFTPEKYKTEIQNLVKSTS